MIRFSLFLAVLSLAGLCSATVAHEPMNSVPELIRKLVQAQRYEAVDDVCDVLKDELSWKSEVFNGIVFREVAFGLDEDAKAAFEADEFEAAGKLLKQADSYWQRSLTSLEDAQGMYAAKHPKTDDGQEEFDYHAEQLSLLVARAELTVAARAAAKEKDSETAKSDLRAVTEKISASLEELKVWEPSAKFLSTEKERLVALGYYVAAYGHLHSGDKEMAENHVNTSLQEYDSPEADRLYEAITGKERETVARGPEFAPKPLVPLEEYAGQ